MSSIWKNKLYNHSYLVTFDIPVEIRYKNSFDYRVKNCFIMRFESSKDDIAYQIVNDNQGFVFDPNCWDLISS